MATSIQIILDLRRKKSDNTYPISYRIIHNRKSTTIRTGYSVEKKYWNEKKSAVKNGCKNISDTVGLNFLLSKKKTELLSKIIDMDKEGILEGMTITEIKSILTNRVKKDNDSIETFGKNIIEELRAIGKYGTADAYKQSLRFLHNYSGKRNITFRQLDFKMLKSLENKYMSDPENHYNGLSVYMRSLRALYNRAISEGIIKDKYYPFKRKKFDKNKYQIKSEKTKKRAVSKEVIKQIEQFDNGDKYLRRYKYYFLFMFYTMGMNMVDMAKLHKRDVVDNTLYYRRSKTGRTYEIRLNGKAWDILRYFGYDNKRQNDFLFPILEGIIKDQEKMRKRIQENVSRTNKHLKVIADKIGLENVKLTTYVSRHSWATIADQSGVSRRLISQGLGHRNQQTTEIYIDDIESNDALADANDLIIG